MNLSTGVGSGTGIRVTSIRIPNLVGLPPALSRRTGWVNVTPYRRNTDNHNLMFLLAIVQPVVEASLPTPPLQPPLQIVAVTVR